MVRQSWRGSAYLITAQARELVPDHTHEAAEETCGFGCRNGVANDLGMSPMQASRSDANPGMPLRYATPASRVIGLSSGVFIHPPSPSEEMTGRAAVAPGPPPITLLLGHGHIM